MSVISAKNGVINFSLHIFSALVAAIILPLLAVNFIAVPTVLLFIELDVEPLRNITGFFELSLTTIAYILFVRFYEKRSPAELALKGRNMLIAGIAGCAMLLVPILLNFKIGFYEVISYNGLSKMVFVIFGLSVVAIIEEFIFRGILFRIGENYFGTIYALISVSLLVSLLSLAVAAEVSTIGFFSTFLINAFWCGLYVWTRNIWVVAIHHAAWNYTEFMPGIMDDHWRISAPVESSMSGPAMITGGNWGPEGSIFTAIVCIFGLIYLYRQIHLLPKIKAKSANTQVVFNAETNKPEA